MLTLILSILGGCLAGTLAALRVIAPLTKNKLDDKALVLAEKADKTVGPYLRK